MGGNGWNEYSRRAYRRALEMDPTRPTCLTSPTCPEARYALRMKTILMTGIAGALVLAAGAAYAQAVVTPKLDTPQAKVIIATLQPHKPANATQGHATHRMLVYLDDGVMTRQEGSNPKQTIMFKRGDVRWRPASGAYVSENTGDKPIRILEVDLKGPASGVDPKTPLDPTVVDAKHYTVMFENEFFRVMRVHYGPRETGARHEHKLNRVVIYLNDQPNAKADDVRMSGPGTHVEENASDQVADRIAVEIK